MGGGGEHLQPIVLMSADMGVGGADRRLIPDTDTVYTHWEAPITCHDLLLHGAS